MSGIGTADDPWVLQTPPGTSEFSIHRDDGADPPELVCTWDIYQHVTPVMQADAAETVARLIFGPPGQTG